MNTPIEAGQSQSAELLPLDALRGFESAIIESFLNLSHDSRESVISEYTRLHGEASGTWLRRAATLWPLQRLGVSRVILARLFALLPEHMSQPQRLQLAKSIWHTARAPTRAVLRVPPGYRNHRYLSDLVRDHFLTVLPSAMELPEALQTRVAWLKDPALKAQHDVLNLLLLAERDQLLTLVDEHIEVLFARRLDALQIRSRLTIAGHELVLRTDADVPEPGLAFKNSSLATSYRRIDSKAAKSAFVGGLIGAMLALTAVALVVWLN